MKPIYKKIFNIFLYIFAAIGLFLTLGFFAVKLGLTNTKGIIDQQVEFFRNQDNTVTVDTTPRPWNQGPEWENFSAAISKDTQVLKRVESETGVPSRLIISAVFVEQMRLYFSERQTFKDLFAPLKILGTQTQFSLGVSGIKQKTAEQVENYLKDPTSAYYLGDSFAHYLDFKTTDIENERFARLTDYKDRYYSYLYTAIYIKELATSWKKAGFDISGKPEILATLFNIGFEHSAPNATPQSGGAEIEINNTKYSFGYLAGEFYYSNELTAVYPKQEFILK
ncbi:MAG: hypothetical protein JWP09_747 [Candidatus Taylorbacteria bacterium]|nr:hypothetical protein [Candidatus Taylorbacteria bacterium]